MCFRSYLIGAMIQAALILTVIGMCEVKVDLADFDLKLQENLLSTLFILKNLPDLVELLT
jgi:hypothetical protein